MSFIKLCNDDDLLLILKDTFKATPIRIPEERIKPLIVFSFRNKGPKYIGKVENLLNNTTPLGIEILNSQMANLSASKSKSVNTNIGLQVMDGFLKGLGSQGASINFAFEGVKKISFSFKNVIRNYVDVGSLCNVLSSRKFNLLNPINAQFNDDAAKCIILDSVITSNNFSIKVEEKSKSDFKFDLPEIEKVLSLKNNKISIETNSDLEISFQGEMHLAFAFSSFVLNINEDGSIYYDGEPDKMYLTSLPSKTGSFLPPSFDSLDSDFGLLEIE